ncbi:UDP-N-acetylglucosamine pyrophosphorylase [Angomonas deanei]|nr:UDP-N-acetylglucosamine pyrophosphorylase [Angomonas deanei]|eukprot:EPY41558.1 UDP-N-acetylglucosamine pyrophosphorylase [Angomonas deanei]
MASESTMCVAPGGNGGVYASLAAPIRQTTTFGDKKPSSSSIRSDSTPVTETTGSLLDLLTARGVQQVQIFNVDNVLAKVADPLLYGYTKQCNAAVVVKTSSKVSPEERVGVFARRNDRWGVVEYTEIGAHATEVNEDGSLRYNCANISVQNCTIGFLRRAAEEMRQSTLYHAARKRIDTINGPVDGVKLEAFIFDMFYLAEDPSLQAHNTTEYEQAMGFKIMQVAREEEFAPVKNADAPGATDCPLTAAQLLLSLHTHRVEDFLAKRVFSSSQDCLQKLSSNERSGSRIIAALEVLRACSKQVQLSPLVSYDGEGLPPVECYLVDQLVDGRSHIVEVESRNMHRSEKTPSL